VPVLLLGFWGCPLGAREVAAALFSALARATAAAAEVAAGDAAPSDWLRFGATGGRKLALSAAAPLLLWVTVCSVFVRDETAARRRLTSASPMIEAMSNADEPLAARA
jgi:hypothetical protein